MPWTAYSERKLLLFNFRRFYLTPPPPVSGLRPLMIVLHGGLGNALRQASLSQFDDLAAREGFYTCYPEGTQSIGFAPDNRCWNAGACCGTARDLNIPDGTHLIGLIDALIAANPIDAKKVYVTGFSNGGMMAARLAGQGGASRIAACVSVSGPLAVDALFPASDLVPVMHIHGLSDPVIPIEGGEGTGLSDVSHKSMADTLALWLAGRGTATETVEDLGDGVVHTVNECTDGGNVELVTIADGGHGWPGGVGIDGEGTDLSDSPVVATEWVWDFCSQYTKA